jgi:hypothetical protein
MPHHSTRVAGRRAGTGRGAQRRGREESEGEGGLDDPRQEGAVVSDPANDTTTRGQAPLQLGPTRMKKGERKTLRARLIADFWPHRVVQQTEGTLLLSTLPSFVKKGTSSRLMSVPPRIKSYRSSSSGVPTRLRFCSTSRFCPSRSRGSCARYSRRRRSHELRRARDDRPVRLFPPACLGRPHRERPLAMILATGLIVFAFLLGLLYAVSYLLLHAWVLLCACTARETKTSEPKE